MIEQNSVPVLETPEIIAPLHPGLLNLASAVAGLSAMPQKGAATVTERCLPPSENAAAPSPDAIRLEQAVQANERLEAVAQGLSIQLRELTHQRHDLRLKLVGVFTFSAAMTVWAIAAAVSLTQ